MKQRRWCLQALTNAVDAKTNPAVIDGVVGGWEVIAMLAEMRQREQREDGHADLMLGVSFRYFPEDYEAANDSLISAASSWTFSIVVSLSSMSVDIFTACRGNRSMKDHYNFVESYTQILAITSIVSS